MTPIPRDKSLDSTLALLLEGNQFISNRSRRYHTRIFQTRLLLQPFICMVGAEAARVFYDNERFMRRGATPTRLQKTLFGQGGVQGLDGDVHRRRKQMFMSLMTPEHIRQLADLTRNQWRTYSAVWETMDRIVLFYEVQEIFCRAVCAWSGVPLDAGEVTQRTREFGAMIDSAGGAGPRHWQGRRARASAERWIGELIEQVRAHTLHPDPASALHVIATYRDENGELLPSRVAAVELINVLRPTVAVARFVIFAAVALHQHPEEREKVQNGTDADIEQFVQEVRRFYPFFPFVAARVRQAFDWHGYHFPKGRRVLLDLYGTNHDPQVWEQPDEFRPERFRHWDGSRFNFIPQGGGDYYQGHRCPGEWITIELMKVALRFLTTSITYDVPPQDLRISLSRMPTIPRSHFVISNVRRSE
jgi:fatty-acid peroxygenase